MSENFLSFIANAPAKAADSSADAAVGASTPDSQSADFKGILAKERAKTDAATSAPVQADDAPTAAAEAVAMAEGEGTGELVTSPEAPVGLPVTPPIGNTLPELSIHSRALQVGRVILTTAQPRVSEESLSQFARSQGAPMPELTVAGAQAIATTQDGAGPQNPPRTGGMLQGLIDRQMQPAQPAQPMLPAQPAVTAIPAANISPQLPHTTLAAGALQEAKLHFMQRSGLSSAEPVVQASGPSQVNLSVEEALNPVAKTADVAVVKAEQDMLTKAAAEMRAAQSPLATVQDASTTADIPVGTVLADSQSEQGQPQAGQQQPAPVANPQSGLVQAPIGNTAITLADALMSSDPAQMQSRLQPYQVWAQRFGEVLAQKLALAVKDGNWTVKLNLNPASLGPVGIELQVSDKGIDGQIAASDANVRQLLGDSMPRLRQALEELVGEHAGVNLELGDGGERKAKQEESQEIEISMDLLAEELIPSQQQMASGNILRDGLNVFV
jgi:flagellar hook-length control protein FliK